MSKKTNPEFQSTAAREKYDQEFSEAMKLKLKLNQEGGLQALRRSIAEDTVKRHPKANIDDIMRAMEEMGFDRFLNTHSKGHHTSQLLQQPVSKLLNILATDQCLQFACLSNVWSICARPVVTRLEYGKSIANIQRDGWSAIPVGQGDTALTIH